jgi:outer membrane lipoprotein-sorting protein
MIAANPPKIPDAKPRAALAGHSLSLVAALLLCMTLALVLRAAAGAAPADPGRLVDRWCAAQTNIQTWTADLVQTRSLKVLTQPLVSSGKVWVAMPDRFRWELGEPAQTIALRLPDQLMLIYPRLKRAEKYPLNGAQTGPWKDALALLDASFPKSRAQLESAFKVLSVTETNSTVQLTLEPKSAAARKFMTEIQITFRTNDYAPAATELIFSDGSSMRNDFTNSVLNAPLDAGLFDPKLDTNFTISEPLGK